jgi:bacterioferritin-associated ferredoxin
MSAPDRPLLVSRCICKELDFSHAREVAREIGVRTVADLQSTLSIGTACGRCVPYVQRTLETGKTIHPLLDEQEVQEYSLRSGLISESKHYGRREE